MSLDLLMDVATNPHWEKTESGFNPKWCKHVKFIESRDGKRGWTYKDLYICSEWKACPVCKKERPKL